MASGLISGCELSADPVNALPARYSFGRRSDEDRYRAHGKSSGGRLLPALARLHQPRDDVAVGSQRTTHAIRLLILTGARLREILDAQWSQLDLEHRTLM